MLQKPVKQKDPRRILYELTHYFLFELQCKLLVVQRMTADQVGFTGSVDLVENFDSIEN